MSSPDPGARGVPGGAGGLGAAQYQQCVLRAKLSGGISAGQSEQIQSGPILRCATVLADGLRG